MSHFPHKDDPNTIELQWKSTGPESGFNLVQWHFVGNLTSPGLDFLRCKRQNYTRLCLRSFLKP